MGELIIFYFILLRFLENVSSFGCSFVSVKMLKFKKTRREIIHVNSAFMSLDSYYCDNQLKQTPNPKSCNVFAFKTAVNTSLNFIRINSKRIYLLIITNIKTYTNNHLIQL